MTGQVENTRMTPMQTLDSLRQQIVADGKVTQEEIQVFEQNCNTMLANKEITDEDFNEALGWFKTDREENSNANRFLKEYIEKSASSQGIKIPEGMSIVISSPKKNKAFDQTETFNDDFQKLLKDVRYNIYGARLNDVFNLIAKNDLETVQKRVSVMKISDEDKSKILKLKELFDNYYKIEARYNGKSYNLLNLSDNDKEELNAIDPNFANLINNKGFELHDITKNFAQKEIERVEYAKAGKTSRNMTYVVLAVIALCFGLRLHGAKLEKLAKLANPTKYLNEQRQIFAKGNPLYQVPKNLLNKIKNLRVSNIGNSVKSIENPFKQFKGMKKSAILGIVGTTLAGSADDICGAIKDYAQDENNFGAKKALAIAAPSMAMGVATSAVIAPLIENMISFNRAKHELVKAGELTKFATLKKLKGMGKIGALVGLGMVAANVLFGWASAVSTSGSSWTSMAGTRMLFGLNGKKLVKKNIISKEENTAENSNKNMMAYEAYKGKWEGISKTNLMIGGILGPLGLLTHANPVVQAATFNTMGCSETLTACAFQMLGDKNRKDKLEGEKEALLQSIDN